MRIATLCPSNTELAVYMGLEDCLVGTDQYSDWPDRIGSLPKLGPDLNIDMDALEALKPDLAVASLSVPGMERNVQELIARGIPHIVLNPASLEDIGGSMLALGEAADRRKAAQAAYVRYTGELERYREQAEARKQAASRPCPSIYWEWWPKPVFTPGRTNWLTELSGLAGGRNLFADHDEPSVRTDWETVAERNPDMIAMVWVGVRKKQVKPEAVAGRAGAGLVEAVKRNRIAVLEEALFCRPSPRLLDGLDQLVRWVDSCLEET